MILVLMYLGWYSLVVLDLSQTFQCTLLTYGLKFIIAFICIFDQGHVNVMQCNGFSNLELFWTKVWKMGFELGGIHSRLSDDLLKVDAVVDGRSWYTFSV